MLVYATESDLAAWFSPDQPPEASQRVIARASRLVRRATINDLYTTDATGMPTDAKVRQAFRDAVCSQIETWAAADVDPAAGAVQTGKQTVAAKKIGSAQVSYFAGAAGSVTAMTTRANAATRLSEDAVMILRDAGLASAGPFA
ncbi:hypothetical protein SAMN06309944_0249 [Micrococcales bacterium KH10]|nr:hypothetical protein SAMN06309944_0249 [Micrococcales bacterium KH10]